MSRVLIQHYLNDLAILRQVSGSHRESVMREAFKDLSSAGRLVRAGVRARVRDRVAAKGRRYVDGALLHALRRPFGYWEAKDDKGDLDAEIALKFKRGNPRDSIKEAEGATIRRSSTRIVLPTTRSTSSTCWLASPGSAWKRRRSWRRCARPRDDRFSMHRQTAQGDEGSA